MGEQTRIWPEKFLKDARNHKVVGLAPADIYTCDNCGGQGQMFAFYATNGPYPKMGYETKVLWRVIDGEWWQGELQSQPCPVCRKGEIEGDLARLSGLRGNDLNLTLSHFKDFPDKNHARAMTTKLCNVMYPSGFVTFHGGYGVGKTMLLKIIVNEWRRRYVRAKYIRMSGILNSIRDGYSDAKALSTAIIDKFTGYEVLCVDEIDRVNLTEWAKETMFALLDQRYDNKDTLLTVMATNIDPAKMTGDLGYLSNRMIGGGIVEVGGPSIRPAQTPQQEVNDGEE